MRRMTYFVMALALVLSLTQCKKEQPAAQNETDGVFITLTLDGGSSNSRVNVNPTGNENYATVQFEVGDVIYVGYSGNYVGPLTYQSNNTFSGNISITEEQATQPLDLYFLGGKDFAAPTIEGNIATLSITDQTALYPVISYARSTYENGSHHAKLINKCSIMKFNVTTDSDQPICITGMNNQVTVNFGNNAFNYGQVDGGLIKMPAKNANNVTWAIVLPQSTVEEGYAYSVMSGNIYNGIRPAIAGGIGSNQYLNDDTGLSVLNSLQVEGEQPTSVSPDGTANYFLSAGGTGVSGTGKANITANGQFELTFKENGTTIMGLVDFGEYDNSSIDFEVLGTTDYYIFNPGATALRQTGSGFNIPDNRMARLHIHGNIECNGMNVGNATELYVTGNIFTTGTFYSHADVTVTGNIAGTGALRVAGGTTFTINGNIGSNDHGLSVSLDDGATLKVSGDVIDIHVTESVFGDEITPTDEGGYHVYYFSTAAELKSLRVWTNDYQYYDISYAEDETWADAVERVVNQGLGWYNTGEYIGLGGYYILQNTGGENISPNATIDDEGDYILYDENAEDPEEPEPEPEP